MTGAALVTGAYGFIGRHTARALAAEGWRVIGIGHGAWERSQWRAWGLEEWHQADVTLETLGMYGGEPELVIHCAGSGSVPYSVSHPLKDYRRTVDTALAVLEYIRSTAPGGRLVMPSSAAVYGAADEMPIALRAPLRPASPYGVHKMIVEELCRSYARHFGLRAALVRFFSVYGTGLRKQLLWDACTKMQTGDFLFMGSGRETLDLLHVEDAAALMLAATSRTSADCPVVNGGAGEGIEVRAVLEAVASALGVENRVNFSGTVRVGDPLRQQAGIAEALDWGWKPSRDWRREVVAYVEWFKAGVL